MDPEKIQPKTARVERRIKFFSTEIVITATTGGGTPVDICTMSWEVSEEHRMIMAEALAAAIRLM